MTLPILFRNVRNLEIEKKINAYYLGINRSEIFVLVDPFLFTRIIKALSGGQMLMEKTLEMVKNEDIQAMKISGITIIRHIFLDNEVLPASSSEFGFITLRMLC